MKYVQSHTQNALQKNWKTPSEFPNCPNSIDNGALIRYKERLINGAVFSKNKYGESIVERSEIIEADKVLLVLTSSKNMKPYALAKVYIEENHFIHESLDSFFKLDGAKKHFTLAQGLEWTGGDTFDDFC